MQYFIGIVPSDEYRNKIIEFRDRWPSNRISEIVEPHITLKAQGGLSPDKEWIQKVEKVCEGFCPFKVAVNKPMFFGDDILYLSASSSELHELHRKIVQNISPSKDHIKMHFELDDFVPHMTLGKINYGLSKKELNEMAKLAEEELIPYPTIEVNFIRVYQESEPGRYTTFLDISLKN